LGNIHLQRLSSVTCKRLKIVTTLNTLNFKNKLCGRPPQYAPPLQVDLLILKVVS